MPQRGQAPQQYRQPMQQPGMYQNVQIVSQSQAANMMSPTHPQTPRMIIGQQGQPMGIQRPQMVRLERMDYLSKFLVPIPATGRSNAAIRWDASPTRDVHADSDEPTSL